MVGMTLNVDIHRPDVKWIGHEVGTASYRRLAVALMAISFFTFLTLLSLADLSFAVPATAASFVIETFVAKYFLKEQVAWQRWTGAGLVACGVALLAL